VKTYTYTIEQVIEVKADSQEEALENLPTYPTFYEGQGWRMLDESIGLIEEKEEEGKK
jgi:hypothetical protein